MVFLSYEKRYGVYQGAFFYRNIKTGVNSFVKPRVLRPDQAGIMRIICLSCVHHCAKNGSYGIPKVPFFTVSIIVVGPVQYLKQK